MNVDDAVSFVLRHRKGKAFERWTKNELWEAFQYGAVTRQFCYAEDENGQCVGVVLAVADPRKQELFINNVLTTRRGALKAMLQKYRDWYDGWTITAERYDRPVTYNTPRLVHLLERMA